MSEQFACASGANSGRPQVTPFFSPPPPLSPVVTFLWGVIILGVFFRKKENSFIFRKK
jgi:hypothetical protein